MGKENPVFFDEGIYRFVILHHTGTPPGGRGDHWDWMFDWPSKRFGGAIALLAGGAGAAGGTGDGSGPLVTFSSVRSPAEWDSGSEFESLPVHRRRYLDYEGPISGNRGNVQRVASGWIRWLRMSTYELAWSVESVEFRAQPFRDWTGASYCLKRECHAVGCDADAGGLATRPPLLPAWLASDSPAVDAASASTSIGIPRWILRRLPGEVP